jgi:DnaJ-class molecular chaperone
MLKYSFRRVVTSNALSLKGFAERIKIKKDYYNILGIPRSANEDDIKKAYRNLAKIYHPDVNIGVDKYEPNLDKFRDIAEAYAVLSNKSMRLDYDMRMRTNSNSIYNAEKMKKEEEAKMNRDSSGNQIKPGPKKGSYADYRLEKLKELRKQFNVDAHGFYKGGIPRPLKGSVRGNSAGLPGDTHDAFFHNETTHDNPHIRPHVGVIDGANHKKYMQSKNISKTSQFSFTRSIQKIPTLLLYGSDQTR